MKTIAESWDAFAIAVMPKEAPAVQRREMKKSFYAGALSLLELVKEIGDTINSEEQAIVALETLNTELETFFNDLIAAR